MNIDMRPRRYCLYCDVKIDVRESWASLFGVDGLRPGPVLCGKCEAGAQRIRRIGCEMCGRPALRAEGGRLREKHADFVAAEAVLKPGPVKEPRALCRDCRRWESDPLWEGMPVQNRSLYVYNPWMQEVLAQYKYRGDAALAGLFAPELAVLGRKFGRGCVAVPVPLAPDRLQERGFNQAALLAAGLKPRTDVLFRTGETTGKQSKRGRGERLASLYGSFGIQDPYEDGSFLKGANVLLVDDLYTTGATLRTIGTLFYRKGARKVVAVTLARAGDTS